MIENLRAQCVKSLQTLPTHKVSAKLSESVWTLPGGKVLLGCDLPPENIPPLPGEFQEKFGSAAACGIPLPPPGSLSPDVTRAERESPPNFHRSLSPAETLPARTGLLSHTEEENSAPSPQRRHVLGKFPSRSFLFCCGPFINLTIRAEILLL
ncbi:hypothetical protein CRENBAI_005279 [Crenichthys baileyi]|uniref:Uncharacterized protein n=1 Tax=Crenichthys baileyi TaxID=28760 RepID=A0AAV9QN83_9TELE